MKMPVKWNLSHLAESIEEIEQRKLSVLSKVSKFEEYKEKLDNLDSTELNRLLQLSDEISKELHKIYSYASLKFSENTSNQESIKLRQQLKDFLVSVSNRLLFFNIWFKNLDESKAKELIDKVESIDHRFVLKQMHKYRKYMLSEDIEKVISIKDSTGVSTLESIRDIMCNDFEFKIEIDGQMQTLTQEELTTYAKDPNPELRRKAYDELLRVYKENSLVLNEIYKSLVSDWVKEGLELRGYESPIRIRNISNDMEDEAVEALLESCRKNRKVFQDYFKAKAKCLDKEQMSRYDIYAPLGEEFQDTSYDDAIQLILKVFSNFSQNFHNNAKQIIEQEHIDAEVRKNKRSGAFCSSPSPDITPYVLLSYKNKVRDVFTLAHELGHGVHSLLSKERPISTYDAPIPLAETASIFSEMLLAEHYLSQTENEQQKLKLLGLKIDDLYASILRQSYFVLFEKEIHNKIEEGITLDQAKELYYKNLKEQFGEGFEIPKDFENEFLYIPHIFHTPFYCYGYAFGQLLVLSLYQMYKEQGQQFVPKIERILSYGGSEEPSKILAEIGIDIKSTEFWDKGFEAIEDMVKQFKELCEK